MTYQCFQDHERQVYACLADPDCPHCEGKGWFNEFSLVLTQVQCDCTKTRGPFVLVSREEFEARSKGFELYGPDGWRLDLEDHDDAHIAATNRVLETRSPVLIYSGARCRYLLLEFVEGLMCNPRRVEVYDDLGKQLWTAYREPHPIPMRRGPEKTDLWARYSGQPS